MRIIFNTQSKYEIQKQKMNLLALKEQKEKIFSFIYTVTDIRQDGNWNL